MTVRLDAIRFIAAAKSGYVSSLRSFSPVTSAKAASCEERASVCSSEPRTLFGVRVSKPETLSARLVDRYSFEKICALRRPNHDPFATTRNRAVLLHSPIVFGHWRLASSSTEKRMSRGGRQQAAFYIGYEAERLARFVCCSN